VNAEGRSALLVGDEVFDLHELSGGGVSADPTTAVRHDWAAAVAAHAAGAFDGGRPVAEVRLGPPVPEPRAVYAVGLNYKGHAEESGMEPPAIPGIFTKFPTSITGPHDDVVLPAGKPMNDWEAELTFVLADGGRHVAAADAYDAILGFTIGQDISERATQFAAMQQFSMGKSFDTFCPIGPAIVTLDELADPADLRIVCRVNGEVVQDDRTSGLIFDVPALVEFISSVCTLRAGDLCLTGTPAGVGVTRKPPQFLQPGDVIDTEIEGLGSMRNTCVAEPA
jgi:2-keto-4-pentenoate hydratase/2-oxohepta-3-ene-1,7-dioic acid hydratase in catechol pathway